jgi:hypothetical protein
MREGLGHGGVHSVYVVGEVRVILYPQPHWHKAGEVPGDGLLAPAVLGGKPDDEVGMPGQPLQQHGERGQQEHSRCHAQIGGGAADHRHDVLGHAPDGLGNAARLHRRPG